MFEVTSLIIISCFELTIIGKFISIIWRVFFDNQLSTILSKLETIYEKLIRLSLVGPMKIKMNWFFIIGITVNILANVIIPIFWMTITKPVNAKVIDMVIINI